MDVFHVFPCKRLETANVEGAGMVIAVIELCEGIDEVKITEDVMEDV